MRPADRTKTDPSPARPAGGLDANAQTCMRKRDRDVAGDDGALN